MKPTSRITKLLHTISDSSRVVLETLVGIGTGHVCTQCCAEDEGIRP